MSNPRVDYAHIELRMDVRDIVEALIQAQIRPAVVDLDYVDVEEDTIWAGDDEDNPDTEIVLHITRDRGRTE